MVVNIWGGDGVKNDPIITNWGRFCLSQDLADMRRLGAEALKQQQCQCKGWMATKKVGKGRGGGRELGLI